MRKVEQVHFQNSVLPKPKNVAAYARVSCGKDEMLRSLAAQVNFYKSLIKSHIGWKFCGVYADEARTGTKDKRENFQRLLSDCRSGKIDMVITKSVSRFARNTVTLLETIRELKLLGIDVYFEEQNIHTESSEGELLITLLASYAQEESRSVSENCKWRIRRNFEDGIANTFSLYGYEKINGEIQVKECEAEIVRHIFRFYLSGMGTTKIAKYLRQKKIPSPKGAVWRHKAISEILKNEKYIGDMLLQKCYSKDHLSKLKMRNNGELPKFYVKDSHPAIISRADFDAVQSIFAEQAALSRPVCYDYDFKGMVFCGVCGCRYMRKKNHGNYIWRCNAYNLDGLEACTSKQIPDSILHRLADECDKPIKKIFIMPENSVKFIFTDNTETTLKWTNPSRRDSWTPEMREAARKKALERRQTRCQEQ